MNYEELIVLIRDPDLRVGITMTGVVHDKTKPAYLLPTFTYISKELAEKFVLTVVQFYKDKGHDENNLDFKVSRMSDGISFLPTGVIH